MTTAGYDDPSGRSSVPLKDGPIFFPRPDLNWLDASAASRTR